MQENTALKDVEMNDSNQDNEKRESCSPITIPKYTPKGVARKPSFVDSMLNKFRKSVQQRKVSKKVRKEDWSSQNTESQTVAHDEDTSGAQGADSSLTQTETKISRNKSASMEQGKTIKKEKMFGSTKRGSAKRTKEITKNIEVSSPARDENFEDFELIQMYLAAKETLKK